MEQNEIDHPDVIDYTSINDTETLDEALSEYPTEALMEEPLIEEVVEQPV